MAMNLPNFSDWGDSGGQFLGGLNPNHYRCGNMASLWYFHIRKQIGVPHCYCCRRNQALTERIEIKL